MKNAQPQDRAADDQAASDVSTPPPTGEAGKPTANDSAGKALLDSQLDFPKVQEHAIIAAEEDAAQDARENGEEPEAPSDTPAPAPAAKPAASWGAPTDYKGRTFDPAIHETDTQNRPVMRYDAKLRKNLLKCKGGRPTSNVLPQHRSVVPTIEAKEDKTQTQGEAPPAPGAPVAPYDDNKTRAAAKMVVALMCNTAITIGGKEFAPGYLDDEKTISERAMLEDAFYEYFKANGVVDIPPGILLLIVVGTYVGKRAADPAVQARFRLIIAKVRGRQVEPINPLSSDDADHAGNGG